MRKIKIIPSVKSKPKIKIESKDYACSEHLAAIDPDKIPYCQNPALGVGAPDCSEECCKFDTCIRDERRNYKFSHGENSNVITKHETYNSPYHLEGYRRCLICGKKLLGSTSLLCSCCDPEDKKSNDLSINIGNNVYTVKEIIEILKKYQEEEDKKLNICYICGDKYLENKKFNMVNEKMEEDKDLKPGTAIGYQIPPIITGIQIQSTCGNGKKIKLCDNCIQKLLTLLKGDK